MKTSKSMIAYLESKKAASVSMSQVDQIGSRNRINEAKIEAIKAKGELSSADKRRVLKLEDEMAMKHHKVSTRHLNDMERMKIYKRRARGTRSISKELAAVYGI